MHMLLINFVLGLPNFRGSRMLLINFVLLCNIVEGYIESLCKIARFSYSTMDLVWYFCF